MASDADVAVSDGEDGGTEDPAASAVDVSDVSSTDELEHAAATKESTARTMRMRFIGATLQVVPVYGAHFNPAVPGVVTNRGDR